MGARTLESSAEAIAIFPILVATAPIALLYGTLAPVVATSVASVVILRVIIG